MGFIICWQVFYHLRYCSFFKGHGKITVKLTVHGEIITDHLNVRRYKVICKLLTCATLACTLLPLQRIISSTLEFSMQLLGRPDLSQ
jgi:hypothetical protein